MKYLLLIALVLGVVWLLRQQRKRPPGQSETPHAKPPPRALEIVACARCALHLPREQTVAGRQGSYCTEAHRREAEGD